MIKKVTQQTRVNDHTGALITAANHLGLPHTVTELKSIAVAHHRRGYMPTDLMTQRESLRVKITTAAKNGLSDSDFSKFHAAF